MTNWRAEIDIAAKRVAGHVRRTPVLEAEIGGFNVTIKLEQMQHTGSFKARGAFNNLLSREVPVAGIVAASGGNHGAAAAFAATRLGHKARIFVPAMAGQTKIDLIRSTGADCEVVEGAYANALEAALAYEADTGAIQLHAYDAPETVAGQGGVFREWDDQGLGADTVLVAVGGGGLISGALGWWEGRRNVVAVEPELAPTLNHALSAGQETDVDVSGIAANALGARRIGRIAFNLATRQNVRSILVSDDAIAQAQLLLWNDLRVLVEPAGATGLAALLSGAFVPAGGSSVAILICGANVANAPLS